MKQTVEFLAKKLVDKPDKVIVQEFLSPHLTVIELTVDVDDLGKVIGRNGQTAEAMRLLLKCVASKEKKRCELHINQ